MVELNTLELFGKKLFERNHCCLRSKLFGKSFSLIKKSTGIGMVMIMKCDRCKEVFDISDYSCW